MYAVISGVDLPSFIPHTQGMRVRIALLAALCTAISGGFAGAVDFEKDVFPILESNCLDCHDRDTLKGGIGLDSFYHATLPTDAGEDLFVAGKPEDSVLLHVVEESDPEKRMPPKGDPLTGAEISTIRKWIEEGAIWPDDGWRPPVHWSFVAPTRPQVPAAAPALTADRNPNEIDRFIVRKLTEQKLALNPETEPARLIRRAYLDITGLPPTPEQTAVFLSDPSFPTTHGSSTSCLLLPPSARNGPCRGWILPATRIPRATSAMRPVTCGRGATGSSVH